MDVTMTSTKRRTGLKRRRIEVACAACRKKKSRCDGERPSCTPCRGHGISCRYEIVPVDCTGNKRQRKSQTAVGLARDLEKVGPRPDSMAPDNPCLRSLAPGDQIIERISGPGSSFKGIGSSNSDTVMAPSSRNYVSVVPDESAVDTLATHAFNDVPARDIGFFGPTSNHALFRDLSNIFAITLKSHCVPKNANMDDISHKDIDHLPRSFQKSHQYTETTIDQPVGVPPEPDPQELVCLVRQYQESIGPLFPFINTSNILEESDHCRARQALMNIVCAHAASTTPDTDPTIFYRRALALLDETTLRGSSIDLLKALLLVANFQQNNKRAVASWTYNGIAVKAAYQLGLHSPSSYADRPAQECELRRMLWHAVVIQDRTLSIALGRPCVIPSQHVRMLPPLLPPEHHRSSASQENEPYYKYLIHLSTIQSSVVESLYDHNIDFPEIPLEEMIIRRLKLILQLETWRQKVEEVYEICPVAWVADTLEQHRFHILLALQYHRTVLLIDGPILVTLIKQGARSENLSATSLLMEQVIPGIRNLVSHSLVLRELIHEAGTCGDTFLSSNCMWWSCNYSCFTVVLYLFSVLLAHQIPGIGTHLQTSQQNFGPVEVREALETALETLQMVQRTSLMSQKAMRCIRGFLRVYDSIQKRVSDNLLEGAGSQSMWTLPEESIDTGLETSAVVEFSDDFWANLVTQSADDFLIQCSDSSFMDADYLFTH